MQIAERKSEWGNSEFRDYRAEEKKRALECIPLAIDARAQRFPEEERYSYQPFMGLEEEHRYAPDIARDILTSYNLRDLGI